MRVTAHPEGKPNISKKKNINQHHPILAFLSEALNAYVDFPEPHLNSYQLKFLEKYLTPQFEDINPHNGQYSSCLS